VVDRNRRRAGITWSALGLIALAEVMLVVVCSIAVIAGFALSGRVNQAINLNNSSPGNELDTAPPPGAQAIPSPAPDGGPGTMGRQAIASRVGPETVLLSVDLRYDLGGASGTGMVLNSTGLVLTDDHVVSGGDHITAQIGGGGRTYDAALMGVDVANDVALLQLEHASQLRPVTLGRSASARLGDTVVVVGYPDDSGSPTSVDGRLIGLDAAVDVPVNPTGDEPKNRYTGMLHSDAPTHPGVSGGPVVDSAGRVIGMAQVGSDGSDDYDIPIDRALSSAREIAAGHPSSFVLIGAPGELGAETRTASATSGMPAGARVVTVHDNTPARVLNLQRGDVITALDGRSLVSSAEFRQALATRRPGDRIRVTWTDRRGHEHTVTAVLVAGPAP
jgi:S1-C subfamily serine protease